TSRIRLRSSPCRPDSVSSATSDRFSVTTTNDLSSELRQQPPKRSSDHLARTSFNVADPLESAFDFKVRSSKLSPSLCSFGHLRSAIVTTIKVLSLKHSVSPSLCYFGLLPIYHRHQLQRFVVVEGLSLLTAVLHLVPKPKPSSAYAFFLRQSM
ncbi:hypothetical protein PIB30_109768, partial [Stylosanthes scabra]|nr:hypothetical protein [Stylosanthes scabra]